MDNTPPDVRADGVLPPIHALVDRTRQIASSFGRRAALRDLQYRLVNRIVPFQVLKGMTVEADKVDPSLLDAGAFDTRFATPHELLRAVDDPEIADEMAPDFIHDAVAKGDECFGVFHDQTLVSYGWYSNRPTRLSDQLVLHFDPRWIYMYKGYTARAHRGQRLHGIGMSRALHAYASRGASGLISYVRATNLASLRSTARMGYRTFGEIYIAHVLNRPMIWATPGCAAYGFRVERSGDVRG